MSYSIVIQALKGGSGSGNFGHAGIPGKHGGSAPGKGGAGGAGIPAAKSKVLDRAAKLGYSKVSFQPPNKKGLIQIVAAGRGGKPKPQNLFIDPDGVIVNKEGRKAAGWQD